MTTTEESTQTPPAEAVLAGIAAYVERERKDHQFRPRDYVYASRASRCDRQLVLEATDPLAVARFTTEVKARLLRGSQRETDIEEALKRAGQLIEPRFDVIAQEEPIRIIGRNGELIISGRIDGKIRFEVVEKFVLQDRLVRPYEIKSWHPMIVERLETFRDVLDGMWTYSGARQLLIYLLGTNQPAGFLILDRPGLPKVMEVELEDYLDEAEGFMKQAERVHAHIKAKTLPDYHPDPSVCRRCSLFGTACNPPEAAPGMGIEVDDEFIAIAEEYVTIQEAAGRANKLKKVLAGRLRGREGLTLLGKVVAEGKWRRGRELDLPEEFVEPYEKLKTEIADIESRFKRQVEKGSFVITYRSVDPEGDSEWLD